MHQIKRLSITLATAFLSASLLTACGNTKDELNPNNPTVISFCAYYNDVQLKELNNLVDTFNETRGREVGVVVETLDITSVSGINQYLVESANNMAGSGEFPDIFITYKSVIPLLEGKKELVNYKDYMSDEELDVFLDKLIEEGYFDEDKDVLSMLPIGSSTEILFVNRTDYDAFAKENGFSVESLKTYEGILEAAEVYYNITDELTPETEGDGKALIGFDSKANSCFAIAEEMGKSIVERDGDIYRLNFTEEVAQEIWRLYCVPTLRGYMAKYSKFASQDLKSGALLMSVGSTAGATYISDFVVDEESGTQKDVQIEAMMAPHPEGRQSYFVQQGGGVFVSKSTPLREKASIEFLRWILSEENNIDFALKCAYMPVRDDNTDTERIIEKANELDVDERVLNSVLVSIEQTDSSEIYVRPYFEKYENIRDTFTEALDVNIQEKRNSILEKTAEGEDYTMLVEEAVSEESFQSWYEEINNLLEAAVR